MERFDISWADDRGEWIWTLSHPTATRDEFNRLCGSMCIDWPCNGGEWDGLEETMTFVSRLYDRGYFLVHNAWRCGELGGSHR